LLLFEIFPAHLVYFVALLSFLRPFSKAFSRFANFFLGHVSTFFFLGHFPAFSADPSSPWSTAPFLSKALPFSSYWFSKCSRVTWLVSSLLLPLDLDKGRPFSHSKSLVFIPFPFSSVSGFLGIFDPVLQFSAPSHFSQCYRASFLCCLPTGC